MNPHRKKQVLTALSLSGALLALVLLLPLTLPVLLGILVAAALNPLILRLQNRTGMGRSGASALCVSGALLVLGGGIWTLGRILIHEAVQLTRQLPALLETAAGYGAILSRWVGGLGEKLPGGAGDAFRAWAEGIVSGSGTLAQSLYEKIFSLVSRLLSALPGSLFFLMTMVLSCYFAAGELPRLRELLRLQLPKTLGAKLSHVLSSIKAALGGWLRAQLMLMGVTFLVLTAGFLLLGVNSPLLLGLEIAFLDALPLFGTGTALIPWALVSMMTGDMGLGIGLLGLYGTAALLRNILEPKLLGAQFGLSPLLTLVAIYAGWRIGGFWGMILLPMGTMVASQLWMGTVHPPVREPGPSASPVFGQIIQKNN